MSRDISRVRAILAAAGFQEWGDRDLFYNRWQRVIFTRERIDHEEDEWVAEKIREGNPGLAWLVHSDHPFPDNLVRLVEDRGRRPDWPPEGGQHANL